MAPDFGKSTALRELAKRMTLNSINVSCGEFSEEHESTNEHFILRRKDVYRSVLTTGTASGVAREKKGGEHRYRCILVVGAGARYSACNELKLGKSFAEELKTEFTKKSSPKAGNKKREKDPIEEELIRLKRVYKLDPKEFETVLYAIAKYRLPKLLERLKKVYDHRYNPSLTYEIIAHLLKHRFVDAVINFNFDELLDQSIADELKADEYHKVLYDGDVDIDRTFFKDGGLKYPLYIKPHGTISHESSLRFTDEAYFGMPKNIGGLMKKLFEAKIAGRKKTRGQPAESRKVMLICIGFNMQSPEFNILLDECLPHESEIYYLKRKKSKPDIDSRPLDLDAHKKSRLIDKIKKNVISTGGHLDEAMVALWQHIHENFSPSFAPRGIERHLLIAGLFNNNGQPRSKGQITQYLWDRAYVEFVLSIAKYKGFACVNQLAEDRFGKYFDLALRASAKFRKTIPRNLLALARKFRIQDWSYGGKAFIFKRSGDLGSLTTTTGLAEELLFHLNKVLRGEHTRTMLAGNSKLFHDVVDKLIRGGDTEISPRFDQIYGHVFTEPAIVRTMLALNLKTLRYIAEDDWNVAYVIAETGEWLRDILRDNPDILKSAKWDYKSIVLIYADSAKFLDELAGMQESHRFKLEAYQMPWWLHNQHLTVFLRSEGSNFHVLRAIYFIRRLRASYINPVLLGNYRLDMRILIETYLAYRRKSSRPENPMETMLIDKEPIDSDMEKYRFSQ